MAQKSSIALIFTVCTALETPLSATSANDFSHAFKIAADAQNAEQDKNPKSDDQGSAGGNKAGVQNSSLEPKKVMTPEEKMQARFPQPAKVSHLVGLPVLDENDSTIGYVQQVVRTTEGKIQLIVPYGKRFGWARKGGLFAWDRRPVAVPIEVVAILAQQIDALDMDRDAFDKAPTWVAAQDQPLRQDEIIKIAIARR